MSEPDQPLKDPVENDNSGLTSSDSKSSAKQRAHTSRKRKRGSRSPSPRDPVTGRSVSPTFVHKRADMESSEPASEHELPTDNKSGTAGPGSVLTAVAVPSTLGATTFGVEFEFVLAFHEDLLKKTLTDYKIQGYIVKELQIEDQHWKLLEKDDGGRQHDRHIGPNLSHNCRQFYPSWVLEIPNFMDSQLYKFPRLTRSAYFRLTSASLLSPIKFCRRYVIEPLLIARDTLKSAELDPAVIAWIQRENGDRNKTTQLADFEHDNKIFLQKYSPDYGQWTLSNDYSVIGLPKSSLITELRKRPGWTDDEEGQWDSYGIELISRVFKFSAQDDAIKEIDSHLRALTKQPRSDILETIWAHTHVHIGFDLPNQSARVEESLRFFQHVAYILILHEDLISKCFPRCSCGLEVDLPNYDPQTPKELSPVISDGSAEAAAEVDPTPEDSEPLSPPGPSPAQVLADLEKQSDTNLSNIEAVYTSHGTLSSNARYFASLQSPPIYPSPAHVIRDAIFDETGTVAKLIGQIQGPVDVSATEAAIGDGARDRGFMVNWVNIWKLAQADTATAAGWKNPKPTLEFRQHPCCINAGQLAHWLKLLKAVMDVASAKTMQTTQYGGREFAEHMGFALREESKYSVADRPCRSIEGFCRALLGLDEAEVEYWSRRYEKFKDDRPSI